VAQLGANAFGEVLEPGRVPDCYLGLRLDPADDAEAAGVLVVAPERPAASRRATAGRHRPVRAADRPPRPDRPRAGAPARHHVRAARLAVRHLGHAWREPADRRRRVIAAWRSGHVNGLRFGGLTAEEALALERPAMT
jgi:hypothetical protein